MAAVRGSTTVLHAEHPPRVVAFVRQRVGTEETRQRGGGAVVLPLRETSGGQALREIEIVRRRVRGRGRDDSRRRRGRASCACPVHVERGEFPFQLRDRRIGLADGVLHKAMNAGKSAVSVPGAGWRPAPARRKVVPGCDSTQRRASAAGCRRRSAVRKWTPGVARGGKKSAGDRRRAASGAARRPSVDPWRRKIIDNRREVRAGRVSIGQLQQPMRFRQPTVFHVEPGEQQADPRIMHDREIHAAPPPRTFRRALVLSPSSRETTLDCPHADRLEILHGVERIQHPVRLVAPTSLPERAGLILRINLVLRKAAAETFQHRQRQRAVLRAARDDPSSV